MVQKLKNLTQLREQWRRDTATAFMNALPPMLIATLLIAWLNPPILSIARRLSPSELTTLADWMTSLSYLGRVAALLPFGLVFTIPLVWMTTGRWPTRRDVAVNQMLRRAAGMSDEVEAEVKR